MEADATLVDGAVPAVSLAELVEPFVLPEGRPGVNGINASHERGERLYSIAREDAMIAELPRERVCMFRGIETASSDSRVQVAQCRMGQAPHNGFRG